MIAEILFYLSIVAIAYTYLGYPLMLLLKRQHLEKEQDNSPFEPEVTVIITAHRGAGHISAKLDNTLATTYPHGKLRVIVVSDGSDDGTDAVVEQYPDQRVSLIRQIPRQGKTAAQKKALQRTTTDIVIFTDLTTSLDADSIGQLLKPLANRNVGLVSSEDVWVQPDGTPTRTAQGAYVKYEMWLRDREASVSSIVSASGCFYAVRKEFFEQLPDYLIDDTVVPLTVVERGQRAVHCAKAVSYVPMIPTAGREFLRRARMTLGGINALMYKRRLLNPFKFGFYSLQLWSHKMFRWLVPFFMLTGFLTNVYLAFLDGDWLLLLILQCFFYLAALVGRILRTPPTLLKLVSFFVFSNLALLLSWYQFFTNPRQTLWSESRGQSS